MIIVQPPLDIARVGINSPGDSPGVVAEPTGVFPSVQTKSSETPPPPSTQKNEVVYRRHVTQIVNPSGEVICEIPPKQVAQLYALQQEQMRRSADGNS